MHAGATQIGRKDRMGNKAFYRIKVISFFITALISFSISTKAAVYTANLNGKYNDPSIWIPTYPGNIIKEGDTVIINNDVKLSTDIVIKGTLMVRRSGSVMGNKNLIVLPSGSLINLGITIVDGLTTKGTVYNNHILEVSLDLINSGNLYNQESIVIGNIVDNIGLVTGNGGNMIANKRFVNSQTGVIKGNIDVCSNNFMNVDGGTIDSTHLSFCGQRIFSNTYLSASVKKDNIELKLNNVNHTDYKKFQVERSVDGINFQTIAILKREDFNSDSLPFKYVDEETIKTNSVYYRVKATTSQNSETYFPEVEVGNIFSANPTNQGF